MLVLTSLAVPWTVGFVWLRGSFHCSVNLFTRAGSRVESYFY